MSFFKNLLKFNPITGPAALLGSKGGKDFLFGPGVNLDPATSLFNQVSQGQAQQNIKAQGFQNLGLQALMQGFDKAGKGIQAGASSAKMDANAAGQQAQAANQQSAINRGVYNTSVYDMGSRGVSSDLARHLASIDAATQQAMGQLETQKAGAIAGSYAGSAGLASNLSAQQTALANPMFGSYGQFFGAQANNHGAFGGLMSLLGGAL